MGVVLSDKGEMGDQPTGENRRRCERLRLSLPVRVVGHDRKSGKWEEMSETLNVSRTGMRLRLRRRVRIGNVLHLMLPLPWRLRQHGHANPSYNVYALVRRVEPPRQGSRIIGLEFLGEYPPPGFVEKPWASFRPQQWAGKERRRHEREFRAEVVWLEYLTDSMQIIAQGGGRTEDLSRSGVRICVESAPPEFDVVKILLPEHGFESLAFLTNRYLAKDGLERLCLRFIGRECLL